MKTYSWSFLTSALPCYFTSEGITTRTHWIKAWVGPRTVLDAMKKIKILPCRESNPDRPARCLSLYWPSYPNIGMRAVLKMVVRWIWREDDVASNLLSVASVQSLITSFTQSKYFFLIWRYSPNLGLCLPPWNSPFHFGLLDLRYPVGLRGWVISCRKASTCT
jgi:hypothetical protein